MSFEADDIAADVFGELVTAFKRGLRQVIDE